jgi:hypothetical protein
MGEKNNERIAFGGYRLHVVNDGFGNGDNDDWSVWLNTEVNDYDGICIGAGSERRHAIEYALATLEAATDKLKAEQPKERE